jgi:hypothetical protein
MTYRERMKWSLIAAALIHLAALALPLGMSQRGPGFSLATGQPPILVTFEPTQKPKQLVDVGTPADSAVDPRTDLIAEQASKASDLSDEDKPGEKPAPHVDTIGPSDQLGRSAPSPAPGPSPQETTPPPAAPPAVSPGPDPTAPRAPQPQPIREARAAVSGPVIPASRVEPAPGAGASNAGPPASGGAAATNPTDPAPPNASVGETRTRVDGGVKGNGFVSFEAMQDDFAPYLRDVQHRVDRRWKALMHVRYSGASHTKAVIDCAIGPDGKLVNVEIIDPGDSATYAGLCKEAIENAVPFPPFPFQVPDVFRTQNLEIRWTFTFL